MLTFNTLLKSISNKSLFTDTCWNVVDDRTGGMLTTGSRTGVNTFVIGAGKISGAVSVDDTLRFAAMMIGVTLQSRGTGAFTNTLTW